MSGNMQSRLGRSLGGISSAEANLQGKDDQSKRLVELLSSKYPIEVETALKKLLALFLGGKADLSAYQTKLIMLLPHEDIAVKLLGHFLLVETSLTKSSKDEVLLSVAPLVKDLVHRTAFIRGAAVKTLSSLYIADANAILLPTLLKLLKDSAAYTRRIALLSLLQLFIAFPEDFDATETQSAVRSLFRDGPHVAPVALLLYDRHFARGDMAFLHGIFRKLTTDLLRANFFDQTQLITLLHRYALLHFKDASVLAQDKNGFLLRRLADKDLASLSDRFAMLTISNYTSIVVAVAQYFLDFPFEEELKRVIRSLVKFLNMSSETKYIVLLTLERVAQRHPKLLSRYGTSFFLNNFEKPYCKLKKIDILLAIFDDSNAAAILSEFVLYSRSNVSEVAARALAALGDVALQQQKHANKAIKHLLQFIRAKKPELVAAAIANLSRVVKQDILNRVPIIAFCLKHFGSLRNEVAKRGFLQLVVHLIVTLILHLPNLHSPASLLSVSNAFVSASSGSNRSQYPLKSRKLTKDFTYRPKFAQIYGYLLELAKFDVSNHVRAVHSLLALTPRLAETLPELAQALSTEASHGPAEESAPAADPKVRLRVDTLSYLLDVPREDCQLLPSEEEYLKSDTRHLREPSVQEKEELSPKHEDKYVLPERPQPGSKVILPVNEPVQPAQGEPEEQPKKLEHLKNILDEFFDQN